MALKPRLVVLSIDGVPYSLLKELIEQRQLPNFARLAAEAGLRQMDSVHPTVSSVAWTSFVTGTQPGKHGIFGFVDRRPGTYDITIPLSAWIRSRTIWEVLSEAGRRVFGMNVPLTYPPRRVNGVLIAGFLTPDLDKVVTPVDVTGYLKSIGYRIDSDPMLARRSTDGWLPDLHQTLDRRMEAMFHFLSREPWDYFHTHIMATDRLHHFLLGRYRAGDPRYAEEFLRFYRKLDACLGQLLDRLTDDAALVVLSDHGFSPIKGEVQLARWLVEEGWTAPAEGTPKHPLDINPEKSKAYCLIPGRIYLNVRGREPAGTVPPEDYSEVREAVAESLLRLRSPQGEPVIRRVYRREELYWPQGTRGADPEMPPEKLLQADSAFGRAPDLVAVPHDGYDLKMGLAGTELFVSTELEGMHTYDDALLMARGIDLPQGRLSILNLTRHIVGALGVEPPEDMD